MTKWGTLGDPVKITKENFLEFIEECARVFQEAEEQERTCPTCGARRHIWVVQGIGFVYRCDVCDKPMEVQK